MWAGVEEKKNIKRKKNVAYGGKKLKGRVKGEGSKQFLRKKSQNKESRKLSNTEL